MSWKRKWTTLLILSIIWLILHIDAIPKILNKNYSSLFHLFILILTLAIGVFGIMYCYYKLKQIEE
ncbi:MAG: hypothetical protein J7K47_04595 [Thermoplasmata archaeon]|nr:hypothetical protein [Thermoplasmata archaeon]